MEHAFAVTAKSVTIMVDGFFALLPNLIIGIVTFLIFLQVANVVRRVVSAIGSRARLDPTLCQALGSLSSFATTIFGMLVVAAIVIPSFKPGNLIAGLGITSVAIGFAFKDILQNFFAGLLLLWQKPFRIGDQIKTQGFEGTVEQIDIRSTRIVTHSGELVVLPNDNIWTNPIIVSTAFEKRRVQIAVTVPAALPVDKARALIVNVLASTSSVLHNPKPQVYLSNLDAGDTKFDLFFWTKSQQEDVLSTTDKVASEIKAGILRMAQESADPSTKAAAATVDVSQPEPNVSSASAEGATHPVPANPAPMAGSGSSTPVSTVAPNANAAAAPSTTQAAAAAPSTQAPTVATGAPAAKSLAEPATATAPAHESEKSPAQNASSISNVEQQPSAELNSPRRELSRPVDGFTKSTLLGSAKASAEAAEAAANAKAAEASKSDGQSTRLSVKVRI